MTGSTEPEWLWDQWGRALQNMSTLGQEMGQRNLDLWSEIARNVRQPGYGPSDMTADAVKVFNAMLANTQASWTALASATQTPGVAAALPTAFLLIANDAAGNYVAPDPVWVRVPGGYPAALPTSATIELTGTDQPSTETLRSRLSARLGQSGQAYLLEYTSPGVTAQPGEALKDLQAGAYTGSVYLHTPQVRALANLRVIVSR